jgi:ATP-dependent DNA helicase DinG
VPEPTSQAQLDLHEVLDRVLDAAVVRITGDPHARARTGQRARAHDTLAAMTAGRYLGAEAPTGSGKSLAALAPAMVLAALRGERSVISTESLGLQGQYLSKDAPVVAEAVAEVTGARPPAVAVLKGWSNHACSVTVAGVLSELTGVEVAGPEDIAASAAALAESGPALVSLSDPGGQREMVELVNWAAGQITSDEPGDRGTYPGLLTEAAWAQVSVSPAECPGAARCR